MFGGLADKDDKSQTTMIRISPIEGLQLSEDRQPHEAHQRLGGAQSENAALRQP